MVTARALRVALDRGLPSADAAATLVTVCRGDRAAAAGALDRLERAYLSQPDDVLRRAVDALRAAVAQLPEPAHAGRSQLHLVAPSG